MRPQARRLSETPGILAGYLPLAVAVMLIMAMVMFVPSEVVDGPASGLRASGVTGAQAKTASGWTEGVEPCEDRELQAPESGYSPPCFTFSGDNGGATARGVTEDTVRISHRHIADGHMPATLAQIGGVPLGEDAEDMWISTEGLVDWFNENFEFYGRKLELVKYDGKGSLTSELFGGGQENANVDARQVVDLEVFADATSFTQPYSEALVDQEVIAMGAPYMSREWFQERYPYAWSNFSDCTSVAELAVQVAVERFMGEPAQFAGGDLAGRRRTIALIHPDTKEYTTCAEVAERMIEDAGYEVDQVQSYPFVLGESTTHATAILAKLRNNKVTTVACGCDPLMVDALTQQAEQQDYQPEWYMLSTGFVDWDLTGQIIANGAGEQWSRSLGVTPTAPPVPFGESEAYRAFKVARPDIEPSQFVDVGFSMLYRLAIGIQMAGPELTPDTFAQGLFNYPGGNGTMGEWKFSPDNPTGAADARMVYWDPDEPSDFNGEPGTYVTVGERFTDPADSPPTEDLVDAIGVLP